jgi:hypothetical protein
VELQAVAYTDYDWPWFGELNSAFFKNYRRPVLGSIGVNVVIFNTGFQNLTKPNRHKRLMKRQVLPEAFILHN